MNTTDNATGKTFDPQSSVDLLMKYAFKSILDSDNYTLATRKGRNKTTGEEVDFLIAAVRYGEGARCIPVAILQDPQILATEYSFLDDEGREDRKILPENPFVVKTDGSFVSGIRPKDDKKFSLEELQSLVGGHIQIIEHKTPGYKMVIHEEGKLEGLPVNAYGTENYVHGDADPVVGDVLVAKDEYLD